MGGSNFNVFGMAGSLVSVLYQIVGQEENGVEMIPKVTMLCGILLFFVYSLNLDQYCTLLPYSVLEGFSFGVGLTIGFGQLNFALGLKNLPHHKMFLENVFESLKNSRSVDLNAFIPFMVFYICLLLLMKYFPGKPWVILIAIIGMIYGFVTKVFFPQIKPDLLYD
jgi:sulfate permease, SulP family